MKLVFIDEAGNPKIPCKDKYNPYFVLTATIFDADHYFYEAEGIIDDFKEKWLGSSDYILHIKELSRNSFLADPNKRNLFNKELNNILDNLNFKCSCILIHINNLYKKYGRFTVNPLLLAHEYLGERLQKDCSRLAKKTNKGRIFIEECNYQATGLRKEDFINHLREEIVFKSPNIRGYHLSLKQENLTGIQITDLCASALRRHAVGLNPLIIDPLIIIKKVIRNPLTNKATGWGWKVFP